MMLEITDDEPREKRIPAKMEMALKASLLEPGMYGYAAISAKAITTIRTSRYVGAAQLGSKLRIESAPLCTDSENSRAAFNTQRTIANRSASTTRFGSALSA